MVDLFHNLSAKSCLDHSRFLIFLVSCNVLLVAAAAFGAGPAAPGSGDSLPGIARFGILNTLHGVNMNDARAALELNINRQSTTGILNVAPELEIIQDAATAADLIRQKHLHGLNLTGIDYILLREMAAAEPLYVASALAASPVESYIVLTQKEIDWTKLSILAQRRLMVERYDQWDIGRIWLETELNQMQLSKSGTFFTAIQAADKPTRLVLPVFFGQAEACLVTESTYQTMVELNPQLGRKLRVLSRSPGVIKSLVCVADNLDPRLVAAMNKKLQDMHMSEDGRQLLMILRLKRFFPFRTEDLEATERILNRYRTLNAEFANQYLKRQAGQAGGKSAHAYE
jgi:phosphonate transport system substrate-binding protein